MNKKKDTIFAVSTPVGKSAIAVIRVSGAKAYEFVKKISLSMPTTPNKVSFNKIVIKRGQVLDQTLTTFFKAPKSYTGEDMVEISTHGGRAVLQKLLDTLKKNKGLRYANPGEFTRRSFENNKLDLTQVEAISDIIEADTEQQRLQATNQLEGGASNHIKDVRSDLESALANIEAIIDFSDEDLPSNLYKKIKEQIRNINKKIEKIILDNQKSEKIREGYVVAIIGETNTGKSSFINNISNKEVAIVNEKAGTTRDLIESYLNIGGTPIRFYDSAGIRESGDKVENIGVKKSIQLSENSDINLVFVDKVQDIQKFNKITKKIFIQSKLDIRKKISKDKKIIKISSKTGAGINQLLKTIQKKLINQKYKYNSSVSRERHVAFLIEAKKHTKNALKTKNFDMLAEDIRLSLSEISKIYGKTDIEDILDIIFNNFCIGK